MMTNRTRPGVRNRKTTLAPLRRDRLRRTHGRVARSLATGCPAGAKPIVAGWAPTWLLPPTFEPEPDDAEDEPDASAVVPLLAADVWVEPEPLDLELVVVVVALVAEDVAPVTDDTTDETTCVGSGGGGGGGDVVRGGGGTGNGGSGTVVVVGRGGGGGPIPNAAVGAMTAAAHAARIIFGSPHLTAGTTAVPRGRLRLARQWLPVQLRRPRGRLPRRAR